MNNAPVFSIAYLPPISYMSRLVKYEKVVIEKHEHFVKQTYRNRCSIYGANGMLDLIIPLEREKEHTPVHLKRISYKDNWRKLHWRSLESAYRSSPYFEYFEQDFRSAYLGDKTEFLFDFNLMLLEKIVALLRLKTQIDFTGEYNRSLAGDDYRSLFTPKNRSASTCFVPVEYHQVFANKCGFLPGLSIADALFNEGLNAIEILKRSDNC